MNTEDRIIELEKEIVDLKAEHEREVKDNDAALKTLRAEVERLANNEQVFVSMFQLLEPIFADFSAKAVNQAHSVLWQKAVNAMKKLKSLQQASDRQWPVV